MDIPIETSRRGHQSGPEGFAMSRLYFYASGIVWYLSHPPPLSVYRYSLLCSLALRLEF